MEMNTAVPARRVAIIGAGPYGLAAAAHLRAVGLDVYVFGSAMAFWRDQMPDGMHLRSSWEASHIADPRRALTLDAYEAAHDLRLSRPIPLDAFVAYGRWFQRQTVPDLDERRVARVESVDRGFRLTLEDGEPFLAQRVIVAAGIAPFAWRPPLFRDLSPSLASHVSAHHDLRQFDGRRVLVVGGGQSALESAALLHEVGADVEVVSRTSAVHWLRYNALLQSHRHLASLHRVLYPPTDVGPPGLNWIVATPGLWGRLPRSLRQPIARRSIRPAGASWLRRRLREVPLVLGRRILDARPRGERLYLTLDDGTERCVDHALLATGYRLDMARYTFLAPDLLRSLRLVGGYPQLNAGLESSMPGLHVLGAPAAGSFGPLMRFVSGTGYGSRALARHILRS